MMRPHVDAGVLRAIAPDELTYPLAAEVEAVRLGLYAFARLKAYDALASIVLTPDGQPRLRVVAGGVRARTHGGSTRALPALTALTRSAGVYTQRVRRARAGSASRPQSRCPCCCRWPKTSRRQPLVALEAVRALAALGGARGGPGPRAS